ncbi:hypothetical protein [uncultured Megasphaera sp.]|nr:hypothetical protein [uncultured Megasphaera sp.]
MDHREAFEEGEAQGIEKGQQKLGKLISLLMKEKRYEDVAKVGD